MQQFAVAGWPVAGRSESLLDVITRRARKSFRRFIDMLNQRGQP
ncbi:protease FtsH-inhibitory lysogeny factor CIII [Erwinia phyllosphaerae]|nr:protease FtsH-inhibitory lysogeny factor CIII [Erwinia phyllosphaerae]MBV4365877.1 protease FtsH-inhibitory lysogeny factor CIII [Erwinia phyllosphaerae]